MARAAGAKKRRAGGGKGYNPYRSGDGKFAKGAHKKKESVAKGSPEANLKTGKRYAARAAHWNKKAAEAAKAGNAEALKFAQAKAAQSHEKVRKALGENHELTKQAQKHRDEAHGHASGIKPTGQSTVPKPDVAKVIKEEKKTAVDTMNLTPAQAKAAKRYHARSKHWEKKAQEAAEKAKSATNDVDRKAAELAAVHAAKKAEASAKLVEKAAGKDNPLAQEARKNAEAAKNHAAIKSVPKPPAQTAPPVVAPTPKPVAKPGDLKLEKGEYVVHDTDGTFIVDHVGQTNIYGKTPKGEVIVVPLKAKDALKPTTKAEYDAKVAEVAKKHQEATAALTKGTVPNTFSPHSVPGPAYTASPVQSPTKLNSSQFNDHSNQIHDSLSYDERSAVKLYSGSSYSNINGRSPPPPDGLRSGNLSPQYHKTVKDLDSAMAKSALPKDTTLYRGGGSASGKAGEMWAKLKPGDNFQDSGFTSTSISPGASFQGGGTVNLEIRAPKGYPGLAMNSKLSHHSSELEVLLPRNTRFKVISNGANSTGGRNVVVEIVPNH